MPPAVGSIFPVPTPLPTPTPASAVNQIRGGEFGHSIDTYFNPPPGSPNADVGEECALWFSNLAPFSGQLLSFIDARTSSVNKTLKAFGTYGGHQHSHYDAAYSDWDRDTGEARFQGTTTLDAAFPNNRCVVANRAVEYLGALIARRNSTIVIPFDCHLFCGLWDNTNSAPRPDWITGTAFALDGEVRGAPAAPTERRYKVYAFTDRGYTYLSTEKTFAAAPGDTDFPGVDVFLTWKPIPGILEYWVYRHDITAGKYRLLKKIGSGNPNYGDNGSVLAGHDNEGGYPAATNTSPIAYVATREHELDNVAADGAPWTSLRLAPAIPRDYDAGTTTGEQVLRLGLTKPLDRMMTDAGSGAGTPNIQSATGAFSANDTGRIATLLDANGNILHGPEAITFTDATHVAFATNVATTNAGAVLYIVAGGDHGLLIDAIHISYVDGAAFAAYPDDLNRLQNGGQNPIAAPNHSSQGGSGGSGGGDPIDPGGSVVGCIALDCPVNVWVGNALESWAWRAIKIGEYLFSGDLKATRVLAKPLSRTENLHLLRVRASWLFDIEVPCSAQQPVITGRLDEHGRAVAYLASGDDVLISLNGHVKRVKVRQIIETKQSAMVGIFTLASSHVFSAGRLRYRSPLHRLVAWILSLAGWRAPVVGVLLHNRKNEDPPIS